MKANMDSTQRGRLYFDGKKIYFDAKEDGLLYDDEKVYMVCSRGSLHH